MQFIIDAKEFFFFAQEIDGRNQHITLLIEHLHFEDQELDINPNLHSVQKGRVRKSRSSF